MPNNSETEARLEQEVQSTGGRANASLILAGLSLLVSIISAAFTGGNLYTQRQALDATKAVAVENQRVTMFSQFQQQYNTVRTAFPQNYTRQNFRPAVGTDDYARLDAYWIFCFSEWYATQRVNPEAAGSLWTNYYAPLIANGLRIPSLRYVLENAVRLHGAGAGDWAAYLQELARIARAHGEPLAPDVESRINGNKLAEHDETEVRFATAKDQRRP